MNTTSGKLFAVLGFALATPAFAQVTLYEREDFAGRSFTVIRQSGPIANFAKQGFNDRASSVVVDRDRWEACDGAGFSGRCVVLRPGRYPSLAEIGLDDRISSLRSVSGESRTDAQRYAPLAEYDSRRHSEERLYEVRVTSARAVAGAPEQRCSIEREQIVEEHSNASVPGAIVGAVVGGVLGHQVGGGHGKDLATVGGAVAGAALGSQFGGYGAGAQVRTQDVERCVPGPARTDYWEVAYKFRGEPHRVAMSARPGRTVTVNERGEPIGATR